MSRGAELEGTRKLGGLPARKGMRMKGRFAKASFALAAALVFISAPVGATVTLTMDGVWWQALTHDEKVIAIQGAQAGLFSGYEAGHIDSWFEAIRTFKLPSSAFAKLGLGKPPFFSKPFGTYVDEIDVWYEVHPKRTGIEPAQLLIDCFADKPAFSPAQCENLGSDADKKRQRKASSMSETWTISTGSSFAL